jgi:hypothetical protein
VRSARGKRRTLLQRKEPERRSGDERERGQDAAHTRAPAAGRQRDDGNQGRDKNKLEEKEQSYTAAFGCAAVTFSSLGSPSR